MIIVMVCVVFCVFKQKTAYEMRISDWGSDVCSSDLCRVDGESTTAGSARICRARNGQGPDTLGTWPPLTSHWPTTSTGCAPRTSLSSVAQNGPGCAPAYPPLPTGPRAN